VARVFTDDAHGALTADDLALVTNLFDARADFHGFSLLMSIGDSAAAGIVRADFDRHPIAGEDADVELPHSPADRGEHDQTVVALDLEHRVRQCLLDDAVELELVALRLFPFTTFTHAK